MFVYPVSASYNYQPTPTGWNILRTGFFDLFKEFTGLDIDGFLNSFVLTPTGKVASTEILQQAANRWNSALGVWGQGSLLGNWTDALFNKAIVAKDEQNNIWRLWLTRTNTWLVNTRGEFPYVEIAGDAPSEPGTAPADIPATPSISRNKFVDARLVSWSPFAVSSYNALSQLVVNLGNEGLSATLAKNNVTQNGKLIQVWYVANAAKTAVYCNPNGQPFAAPVEPAAKDINFDIIVDNSKTNSDNTVIVDNSKILDTVNNVMTVINEHGDKITYNIDSLYYDGTTNTYTANTYQYNDNSQTYNYYTWNITYNIQNTYINYIGSNVGFEHDEYKYYYQLPDGRSSEDLTAEEVGAMSFQFADVTNYARSATDTSLRALYHLDGNVDDSSYFSTQNVFKWEKNASITYMDSSAFNGALYLDEREHEFDIILASNFGKGDFSLQFRHYQASQPDTVDNKNNFLSIGGYEVLRWDEQKFYMGSSTATIPIGNWHEIAFVRSSGVLYFYVNGLMTMSAPDTRSYAGHLMFTFGATSRGYTMLDEIRVVDFAIANSGKSYQCATVPQDTNLVLVLPDGEFPIADEYYNVTFPNNSFFTMDFSKPSEMYFQSKDSYGNVQYGPGTVSLPLSYNYPYYTKTYLIPGNVNPKPRYLAFLFADGSISYANVPLSDNSAYARWYQPNITSTDPLLNGRISVSVSGYNLTFAISVYSGAPILNIVGIAFTSELPTSNNFYSEKVSCVYSSEDIKPNTAAVQSSIPVTGYTVGGVRPTFPERGNVWFPVSGNRINGCYIYDGSMWRVAGCRYYTGTRWIPIYAFDIYTLADCWDVADAVDVTPPITTEYDFWNWWKKEWTDFRAWLRGLPLGGSDGTGTPPVSPEECEHVFAEIILSRPTCTLTGSKIRFCSKCGTSETIEIPALGHDWLCIDSIPDELDEEGNVIKEGYDLYECSICKEQYRDYDRTGPPDEEGGSITQLIKTLFDKLGALVGGLIDKVLGLAAEALEGFGAMGDYFKEQAEQVSGFGGGFLLFLAAAFDLIPPEIMACISIALVLFGVGLFVKKVLLN